MGISNKLKVSLRALKRRILIYFGSISIGMYKAVQSHYQKNISDSIAKEKDLGIRENFAFVITTFEDRLFSYALPLVESLRLARMEDIYLVINGNFSHPMNNLLRKKFFKELSAYDHVFPITFGLFHGCSSMWNAGVSFSKNEIVFILNDDVHIDINYLNTGIKELTNLVKTEQLVTINSSWSHFVISKKCIYKVGKFDERFLGIGEEDGDYNFRFELNYGRQVSNFISPAFINLIDNSRDKSISSGNGKYSLFNKIFQEIKYSRGSTGVKGMFSSSMTANISLEDEKNVFKWRNSLYHLLESKNEAEIRQEILATILQLS